MKPKNFLQSLFFTFIGGALALTAAHYQALSPAFASPAAADETAMSAVAADPGIGIPMTNDTMNGYSLKDFPDFERKWHFVTPRYRKDLSQIRLVYANDIAWKAMLAGTSDYPDGAVFAKIAFGTHDDPSFTSSVIPSNTMRYQFMVRNHKKHKDTDGWGYAIFDGKGRGTEQDVDTNSQACAACHAIVPERGFVFSVPISASLGTSSVKFSAPDSPGKPTFITEKADKMPPNVREILPAGTKDVRQMKHARLEATGSADKLGEMRPMLSKEAVRTRKPAVLVNQDASALAAAYVDETASACLTGDGKKGELVKEFLLEGGHLTPVDYCEEVPSKTGAPAQE